MIQCKRKRWKIMIDITKAKKEFKEYIKNYNPEDKKIALKIAHIERTSYIARKIAESLNLDKEDIELATLIGLLHDIGRFEQIKQYHTFSDKDSINHGEFGVEILFEDGKIRDFITTPEYDEIIKKAIINHNRSKIEEGLTERELLHAKIVRDADKIDIFNILTFEKEETLYDKKDISNEKITDEIYQGYIECQKVDYKKIQSIADQIVAHFAYVYDFNFKFSIKFIYDNQYLNRYYERHRFLDENTIRRYDLVYNRAMEFVKENIGDNK